MTRNGRQPVLVVVQLTGGNDFMNTVVPYTSPHYYDARQKITVPEDEALPIDGGLGFHPSAAPLKEMYDQGDVAVVQGVGHIGASRSHFRAMDVWHTCEPVQIGSEGWLGRAIREIDPGKENVLTGVNIGRGLPRAMVAPGVPVSSVGDLDNYGILTGVTDTAQRAQALETFKGMYAPAIGTGPVMDYLSQTGQNVLRGADILKTAPVKYASEVEYADTSIARSLRTWRESIWPGSALASSTPATAVTTPTPISSRTIRCCWRTFRPRSPTSSRTSETTTRRRRSRC